MVVRDRPTFGPGGWGLGARACASRLQSTDFVDLVLDALRPVSGLGLALDVVAIAEEVAVAD
jgi:hypothetical protein